MGPPVLLIQSTQASGGQLELRRYSSNRLLGQKLPLEN